MTILGSNANVWSHDGVAGWFNHGKPGGNGIFHRVGVANAGNNGRPYAFVTGTDGNLWSQGWHGSAWVWENHGLPGNMTITGPVGAIGVSGDRPYAYVMATDGALWQRWWTGSAWAWSSHGAPPP